MYLPFVLKTVRVNTQYLQFKDKVIPQVLGNKLLPGLSGAGDRHGDVVAGVATTVAAGWEVRVGQCLGHSVSLQDTACI